TGVPNDFIQRMNSIPKYVASKTLRETTWNAKVIEGDVATFVASLKLEPGGNIVKYGNGRLDATLMEHGLIDEFHLLVTPVAVGQKAPKSHPVIPRSPSACVSVWMRSVFPVQL